MINIAIVDDEEESLKQEESLIRGISDLSELLRISTFQDAKGFLKWIDKNETVDILFCDIEMDVMNGIKLGALIREKYPLIYLIFLTSHSEYAVESYQIDAYQYIMKEHMKSRIPEILKTVIKEIQCNRNLYRVIHSNGQVHKINYNEILYIQKIKGSKYVEYITRKGIYRERMNIEQVIIELNTPEFILVERGYIVNIHYIVSMKGNVIRLEDGTDIFVSRGRSNDVRQAIHRSWEK